MGLGLSICRKAAVGRCVIMSGDRKRDEVSLDEVERIVI
jgi:hypothetical protein